MSEQSATRAVDVDEIRVAQVYAKAAWSLAERDGVGAEFLEEYRQFVEQVLDKQPELETFFRLNSIGQDHKAEMLERIFKGRTSDLLYQTLRTLNAHDRLGLARAVLIGLVDLSNRSQGKVPVKVRSAVSLSAGQKKAVTDVLAKRLKITPILETEVDPDLLGGLWIKIGDQVFDRTVRFNLNQIRENILTRSSHEIQSGRDSVDRTAGN
jgi:F-type H+-transporting ATPase subunit delta